MANATLEPPKKPKTVAPMQGERQDQFFDRASRALQKDIPSVNQRTLEILRLWNQSPESAELSAKANAQFPESDYTHFGPRCIFLEHTIPGSDDQAKITYDRNNLAKLVNWANHRIADSSTFAAISDGHTPSEEERAAGHEMPEVLGYSGPFYLGLLGDKEPKWAIYADEWVHNEDLAKFKKLQRRSPEVWVSEPMERRTMDPIAALGAETPRLDSGMNPYSRISDGKQVMRYSAAGGPMVMPGPSNVYIPSGGKKKSQSTIVDYSGDSEMDVPGAAPEKPDMGTIIANALMGLAPSLAQAINQAMSPSPELEPEEPAPRGMEQPDAPGGDEPLPDGSDAPGGDAPAAPTPPLAAGDDNDNEEKKYQAMGADYYAAYCAGMGKSKYSKSNGGTVDKEVHALVGKLQTQLNAVQADNAKLRNEIETERRDVARYSKLNELAEEYDFDVKEEQELVADYSDEQFERHITKTITRYSKRDDVLNFTLPMDPDVDVDKYSRGGKAKVNDQQVARYSREAADRAARKIAAGEKTNFEAEYAAICKEHGVAV